MTVNPVEPRTFETGGHTALKLPKVLSSLSCMRPLIDQARFAYVERSEMLQADRNVSLKATDNALVDATAASISTRVERVSKGDFGSIPALGGGSPINNANVISIYGTWAGELQTYRCPYQVNQVGLQFLDVPTTAATGSKVTPFTVITYEKTGEMLPCVGDGFMHIAALFDCKSP